MKQRNLCSTPLFWDGLHNLKPSSTHSSPEIHTFLARCALSINPASADAYVQLSNAFLGMGERSDARATAEQAIRLNPSLAAGYQALGSVHLAERNFDRAIEALQRAQALEPLNALITDELTRALEVRGRALD